MLWGVHANGMSLQLFPSALGILMTLIEIFFFLAEIFDDFILIFMKLSETSNFQILLENIIS